MILCIDALISEIGSVIASITRLDSRDDAGRDGKRQKEPIRLTIGAKRVKEDA